MEGIKHDQGKTRFSLLVPEFIKGMADVMTDGVEKYSAWNWEGIEDHSRVLDAHMRHMFAQWMGEDADAQSGHDHLFHVACNAMMLWKLKQGSGINFHKSISENESSAGCLPNSESADINTENVKIRGDLVAVRWTGENFEEFKRHWSGWAYTQRDNQLFLSCGYLRPNTWAVYHKSLINVANSITYSLVTDEIFNEKLKHLFE